MVRGVVRQSRIDSSVASVLPAVLEGSGGVTVTRTGNVTTIGFDLSSTNLEAELQQAIDALKIATFWITPQSYGAIGDGVTDDTVALQSALNSGEACIAFPAGSYAFTSPISVPPSVKMLVGPGKLLFTGDNIVDGNLITVTDSTGIIICGMIFNADHATYTTSRVLVIQGSSNNVRVENCWFEESAAAAILVQDTAADCHITHNRFENFIGNAVQLYRNSANCTIAQNRVLCALGNTGGPAIFAGTSKNITIAGNIVDRSFGFGISLDGCVGAKVCDNVILNSNLEAIRVDSNATGAAMSSFLVDGNVISFPDEPSADYGIGIGALSANAVLEDGQVSNNIVIDAGHSGIAVTAEASGAVVRRVTVSGNKIVNPNEEDQAVQSGVLLASSDAASELIEVEVKNNIFRCTSGFMRYGVVEDGIGAIDSNLVADNLIVGAQTAAILLIGSHSRAQGNYPSRSPLTKSGDFSVDQICDAYICSGGATITATLPFADAALHIGRELLFVTTAAFTVVSASSNVVPITGGSAGTAILAATAGKWARLKSDGTNWIIIASN